MASSVPIRYVESLLRLSGASRAELRPELAALGINTEILLEPPPAGIALSNEDYGRLFMHLIKRMQAELATGAGELDSLLQFSTYRMMYQAMVHAPNLNGALQRAAIYFKRFQPNGETFHLEPAGSLVRLRFDSQAQDEEKEVSAANFCMGQLNWLPGVSGRLLALSLWHRTASWCVGSYIDLERVELPGEAKSGRSYQDLFGTPVEFGALHAAFYFNPRYLDFPVVQSEVSLGEMLDSFPARLLELDQLRSSLSSRVRALIGTDFSEKLATLPEIADRLCMTTATLHRHLKSEGFTWQRIKDETRRDAAISYLLSDKYSNTDLAEQMGFSDISAFHRAFKKWTGKTPQQYRQQHRPTTDNESLPG